MDTPIYAYEFTDKRLKLYLPNLIKLIELDQPEKGVEDLSWDELRRLAAEKGVTGRGKMNRAELERAVKEAE